MLSPGDQVLVIGSPSQARCSGPHAVLWKLSDQNVLGHLDLAKQAQLIDLIEKYRVLFGIPPTQAHLSQHDIEVGGAKPIRQPFHRVHPGNVHIS